MPVEAVVLVSAGRHPLSLRGRLPELEARAIGVAVWAGVPVTAVHAGPSDAILRLTLGLGAQRAVLIEIPEQGDALPALLAWLADHRPALILTGERAETGEGSGMVPYVLAEALGAALVARAVGLEAEGGGFAVLQANPGGRRRVLQAEAPLVLAIGASASPAPLCALGPARRATVEHAAAAPALPDAFHGWTQRPARKRPRRLSAPGAGGAEREPRREIAAASPVAAADAILDFLEREALLNPPLPHPRP